MSTARRGIQRLNEILNTQLDLVADFTYFLNRLALGVFERPILALQSRNVRTGFAAAHRHQQLCVTYERLSNGRYRNSDGVEFCLGPCKP